MLKKNKSNLFLKSHIIEMIIVLLLSFNEVISAENRIVAIVNGEKIKENDININVKNLRQAFKIINNREPTNEELDDLAILSKKRKLIHCIKNILFWEAVKIYNIEIKEEEIKNELKRLYSNTGKSIDEILKEERDYWTNLYQALKEVQKEPKREKEIYEKYLKNLMSYKTWEVQVNFYNTPEKLIWIKNNIPRKEDDLYNNPGPFIRKWVIENKLREAITKDITVTEQEIKKFYESYYCGKNKPEYNDVKEKIKRRLLKIKKNKKEELWWKMQYQKAKIKILDDRYKDVIKIFKSS